MKRSRPMWSRQNLESAVHLTALYAVPPVAGAGAWAAYWASGWGPGGVGGTVRGAVLAIVAALVAALAVAGALHGSVVNLAAEQGVPKHPVRYLLGYAAAFSAYLLVALALVLVPLALILSI
jgi:hypothetical protein